MPGAQNLEQWLFACHSYIEAGNPGHPFFELVAHSPVAEYLAIDISLPVLVLKTFT